MTENIGLAASHGVLVGNSDYLEHRVHARFEQSRSRALAQSPVYHVFLDGDDRATLLARSTNRLDVERLDGRHTQNAARQAMSRLQLASGNKRVRDRFT